MANYNERDQVGNLLKKFTENRYYFKDSGYYNFDTIEILQQETEKFSIKLFQGEKISKLAFFDKNKEELFMIIQRPSSSIPDFEMYDNKGQRLDYETQSKILSETKNIVHNFEVFFEKEIENVKARREKEHKDKLNNIYQHFGVKELDNNPPQVLGNDRTYKHGVDHLIQYLFKKSPNYLYEKNKNGDLVYSLKTSMGEIEVNFGPTSFHVSEKRLKINFLNEQKETVFSINGFKDKMFNEEIFDMKIWTKNTLINGYEENVVLATIPTEKIIKEMIEIINKDINNFQLGIKKDKEDLLKKVIQLNQTEPTPEVKVSEEPIKNEITQLEIPVLESKTEEKVKEPISKESPHKNIILKIRERLFSNNKNNNKNNLN